MTKFCTFKTDENNYKEVIKKANDMVAKFNKENTIGCTIILQEDPNNYRINLLKND